MTRAPSASASAGLIASLAIAACGYTVVDFSVPMPRAEDAGFVAIGAPLVLPESALPSPCPARRPGENTPCVLEGRICEYGAHADMRCNTRFTCAGGAWQSEPHLRCPATCPVGADAGTATMLAGQPCDAPSADGGTFDIDDVTCPTADGYCTCTNGVGADEHPRRWVCFSADRSACPLERPLLGQSCGAPPSSCDYGHCVYPGGAVMTCVDGTWTSRGLPCE